MHNIIDFAGHVKVFFPHKKTKEVNKILIKTLKQI